MMEKSCKKMIKEQNEKKKCVCHPEPIPDKVLYKKRTKKDEKDVEARRNDALSRPYHFWECFGSYTEEKQ